MISVVLTRKLQSHVMNHNTVSAFPRIQNLLLSHAVVGWYELAFEISSKDAEEFNIIVRFYAKKYSYHHFEYAQT